MRTKSSTESGSFVELEDGIGMEADPDALWPAGYPARLKTEVVTSHSHHGYGNGMRGGERDQASVRSDEIPLDSITVKRDLRWSEVRRG